MISKLKIALCTLCLSLVLPSCDNKPDDVSEWPVADESELSSFDPHQQATYRFLIAEIALDRGDYTAALEEYIQLVKDTQDPILAARATSIAIEQELYESAAVTAKIWADNTLDDPQTQAIVISILLKNKDINGAMPYLERVITTNDEETFRNLVFIQSTLENLEDYQEFIKLMQKHGQEQQDFRTTFMAAQGALETGELDMALANIDQVLAMNKQWIRPVALKIQILYETGKKEEAAAYLEETIPLFPDNGSLKWLKAQMLLDRGMLLEGEKILKTLQNDPIYSNDAYIELARVFIQQQKYKDAETLLNHYLSQPNITMADSAYYLSAFTEQQLGNLDLALSQYRKVQQGPYFVNSNIQISLIYAKNGYTDTALETLNPLLEQYPNERSRIELVRTQILLDAYRIEEAYDELNRVISNRSEDTELRYIRGLIATELKKTEQAESDFRYVISQQPTHIEAINDLTRLLITSEEYQDAMQYAEQAMTLAPANPETLANMGWLQYKLGQHEKALENLQKSYQLDPQPQTAAHLGEVMWSLGQQNNARDLWQTALKKYPNNEELIQIIQAFSQNP